MSEVKVISDPRVAQKFDAYPGNIRPKLEHLRRLILEVAAQTPEITSLEETLKWNEPSYLTKQGSTLRMDWKEKTPDQYALYFKCTSKLVPTFKEVYGDLFSYETSRAIVFQVGESIPEEELKKCIRATLLYHQVKQQVGLGM